MRLDQTIYGVTCVNHTDKERTETYYHCPICNERELVTIRQQLSAAEEEIERSKSWPHCEACNFPLQDQGTPNGLVCLLCDSKEEVKRLQNHVDLMVDEFKRIRALEFDSEINALCERAIYKTRQHVPVIEQRDLLTQQNAELKAKLAEAHGWISKQRHHEECRKHISHGQDDCTCGLETLRKQLERKDA